MSEIVLLTSKYCGSCGAVKERLKRVGKAGRVREVDVDTPEGQEIVKRLNVTGVPDCFLVDRERKTIRRCSDDEFVKLMSE